MFDERPDLWSIVGVLFFFGVLFATLFYVFGLLRVPPAVTPRVEAHQVYLPMVMSSGQPTPTPKPDNRLDKVPFYSQIDPRWSWVKMGGPCTCKSIGACGCAVTSTAMVFSFYGVPYNPKQMSGCLGQYACPISWTQAAKRCGKGTVFYEDRYNFNWKRLDRYLNEYKYPVIIGLYWASNPNSTHFVVAVSGSGSKASNYRVHDPNRLFGKNIRMDVLYREGWRFRWLIVYEDKVPD